MGDIGPSLDALAHSVGETTEQATLRYAVGVSRTLAEETEPKKSTVRSRKEKAAAVMRKVVEPMPTRYFARLQRDRKERAKLEGEWGPVDPSRLLGSDRMVWATVEKHRDSKGRTRELSRADRYFCKEADFNRVVRRRARLWGVAKGSWLGAGMDLARRQQGLNRLAIGKNFLAWAQRHADKGKGWQLGSGHETTAVLGSRASALRGSQALSRGSVVRAMSKARRAVFSYYSREWDRMHKKVGARRRRRR